MAKAKSQRLQPDIPLQSMASIRAANSTSFKPAEEQFIEQTPWANPQHPSHAHLLQRQASAHQAARTSSPFSMAQGAPPRRHSHQQASSGPIAGTFGQSAPAVSSHTNGAYNGGRTSPLNPFANITHAQKVAPSPLGSRHASPQQSRPQQSTQSVPIEESQRQDAPRAFSMGPSNAPFPTSRNSGVLEMSTNFAQEAGASVKREQLSATNGRY